jgi:hypothetical protein
MGAPRKALTTAVAAAALTSMAGVANGETITAIGTSQVKVVAPSPLTNAKIVQAVALARRQAVPLAFEAARVQALRLAIASGLQPGAITAVEETGPSPYGFFYGSSYSRFGSNQYCGRVQQARRAPRQADGRRGRIISRRSVIRCFKPPFVGVSISVTYEATPAPPTPPS